MSKKRGPKPLGDSARKAEVKISLTNDHKNMIDWLAKNVGEKPKPTATFLHDLIVDIFEQKRLTLNIPGEATVEMRSHYKKLVITINKLTRDYVFKTEYLRNADIEGKQIAESLKELLSITRKMYELTTFHNTCQKVDSEFWENVKSQMQEQASELDHAA